MRLDAKVFLCNIRGEVKTSLKCINFWTDLKTLIELNQNSFRNDGLKIVLKTCITNFEQKKLFQGESPTLELILIRLERTSCRVMGAHSLTDKLEWLYPNQPMAASSSYGV